MSITSDYGSYSPIGVVATGTGIVGAFLAVYIILLVVALAASILVIVSEWKIFSKENKPGWYSLIPFLNNWTLFEIVGVQGWWSLIPFANIVYMFIVSYKLAIKYGKSSGVAVVTALFPFVGYPMIAFGKGTKTESKKEEVKTVKTDSKFCPDCGAELKEGVAFCPGCGKAVK